MLSPADFAAFMAEVHGVTPFAWQERLCHQVLEMRAWPTGIDVPTGLGKTAVADIAVFGLAVETQRFGAGRQLPLRTFLCVDRRLLVDQAGERADVLARALERPSGPVTREVAAVLQGITSGGKATAPLVVGRLRGGTAWRDQWLERPDQAALITATVDQLGSRLLFRAYGASSLRAPIEAALVGTDSLVVLDEAHISSPFAQLLEDCRRYEATAARPVSRPMTIVTMSATPQPGGATFHFDEAEEGPDVLRRYRAPKPTRLVDVPGIPAGAAGVRQLAAALADAAMTMVARGAGAVAVVANSVDVARCAFDILDTLPVEAALMIGRCRDHERDVTVRRHLSRIRCGARDPATGELPMEPPLVVVATQAIEVGADVDVDALVTEAAPLDALTQRLGRLDRLGRSPHHLGAVIVHATRWHDDHPLYGAQAKHTWDWLLEHTQSVTVRHRDVTSALASAPKTIDLSAGCLADLLRHSPGTLAENLTSPAQLGPVLFAAHLDRWACTSPRPHPDQPVAPFLHGLHRNAATVTVAWRAGLPLDVPTWAEELASSPLSSAEQVEVPLAAVRRFLAGGDNSFSGDTDVEGETPSPQAPRPHVGSPRWAAALTDDGLAQITPVDLTAGMVIVLPSELGGHDQWGWTGTSGPPVPDIADIVVRTRLQGRIRLRAAPLGIDAIPHVDHSDGTTSPRQAVCDALSEIAVGHVTDPVLALVLEALRHQAVLDVETAATPAAGWQVARWPRHHGGLSDPDDTTSSWTGVDVTLSDHLRAVAERADGYTEALGIAGTPADAVSLAAVSHDLGKEARRFQVMLHGGDALTADADGRVLAKSRLPRSQWRAAAAGAGWPPGVRHEAVTLALLKAVPDTLLAGDAELVRHLAASHHGHARPLFPPAVLAPDLAAEQVTAHLPHRHGPVPLDAQVGTTGVAWDHPASFRRLCHRYGWWGLALLETLVRLADTTCSQDGT
jgi:CRISPR-associated endonuclease/helicase Cas3